jgi:hypothetical protein
MAGCARHVCHLVNVTSVALHHEAAICVQTAYEVLTEQQLWDRQAQDVQSVTSVLGISDGEAARVLRYYKWCVLPMLPCRVDA